MSSYRGLLWGLMACCIGFAALPSHADVLFAVRVLREGGCGGALPRAPQLHHNRLLDRSAQEWAVGRTLTQAVDLSGYHAVSAAGLHVRGPDEAMLQLLERSGCKTLASQGLHEIGIYRRGFDAWIVLATGNELTAGASQASAAVAPLPPVPESPQGPQGASAAGAVAQAPESQSAAAESEGAPAESRGAAAESQGVAPGSQGAAPGSQGAGAESQGAGLDDAAIPTPAPDAVASAAPTLRHGAREGRALTGGGGEALAPSGGAGKARPPSGWAGETSAAGGGTGGAAAFVPVPRSSLSPILATRALQLVNNVRAKGTRCGNELFGPAPPITLSGTLAGVAFGHANDMATNNYFEHEDLQGKTPSDRVRATGYQEKLVGENIAYGPKSVDEVVQGWLDSPGHCENIMDPRFVEMGLGYATSHDSKHALYWVQVLATPRNLAASARTASH